MDGVYKLIKFYQKGAQIPVIIFSCLVKISNMTLFLSSFMINNAWLKVKWALRLLIL